MTFLSIRYQSFFLFDPVVIRLPMSQQWRFGFSTVLKGIRYAMMNYQAISRVDMEFMPDVSETAKFSIVGG
jgi:hypothetical protein